ncbi:MAG: phosphomannomutase [Deltaproteobacteria bacterium]|nr:phosphomannomutase [Deltaproteobacteria bacterium]
MSDSGRKGLSCFKAYDIRGRISDELDEELAYKIGRAYATLLSPKRVCVGRDVRLSSEAICAALAKGLNAHGCDVVDIGLCPTEEIYFVTAKMELDGGIMVTASHNPMDYNGMKLVKKDSRPISADTGLQDIERIILEESFKPESSRKGEVQTLDSKDSFVEHLLSYIDPAKMKKLKVVMNCGNGCANVILEKLEDKLPIEFTKLFPEPDGTFPNGIPNPILPENRGVTAEAVRAHSADLGIAWDGDCDRCFFFDENGDFIEGYYIVGFMAQAFLRSHPGAKVVHDPRLVWNTMEIVKQTGGIPVMSKAGHAFIKERMRKEDAIYGGEMSAHHYFREFAYCDSGMIPWLHMVQLLSQADQPLSQLVQARMEKYPVSGEINRAVKDPQGVLKKIEANYRYKNPVIDYTDGLSMEFDSWRFNLRPSNTEPVIRLNVEVRQNKELLAERTEELLRLIEMWSAT